MFILPHLKGLTAGYLGSAVFKNAGLDLKFAENKSLVDSISGNNLITFNRAAPAGASTYVDSDGVLQLAVTNLLLRSEEFDNASWTKTGLQAFGSGSVANTTATTAPDGTFTADKIVEDTSTGPHRAFQGPTFSSGLAYTASVFVKAAERTRVSVELRAIATLGGFTLNLITGAITGSVSGQSASVTSFSNGWWRISITASSATATGSGNCIIATDNGSTSNYTGDGTSGIYIWGAQIEQSATVGEYIPTTSTINSAPRFDHNPTTGESLGLLVEEARTNVIWPSADYSGVNWVKSNIQVSAATTTAPDGSTCFGYEGSSASSLLKRLRNNFTTTTVGTYTWSIYLKAGTEDSCVITIQDGTGVNGANATILLTNGTVTTAASNNGVNTGAAISVQAASNGFYRVSLTSTFVAALTQIQSIITWDVNGSSTTTGTLFPWGAQLEDGAFPTSYIPTTTATVTRAADVASITGSNFSSWYNQTEGTVFADVTLTRPPSTVGVNILGIGDGTNSNRVQLNSGSSSAGNINGVVTTGGVAQAQPLVGSISSVGPHKIGFGYATNNVQIGVNGSLGTEDTSATMPSTITAAYLANGANPIAPASMTFARLTYWPTRFINTTLELITQA